MTALRTKLNDAQWPAAALCSPDVIPMLTQPSAQEELYPRVWLDVPSVSYQAGCAVHRIHEPTSPVRRASHDASRHDHEWYSHRFNVALMTLWSHTPVVSNFRYDLAVRVPPSSE